MGEDRGGGELCEFFEGYSANGSDAAMPNGIYSLDDLKEFGREKGWCPYYLARHIINHANVLVYNYQYMLDPKVCLCFFRCVCFFVCLSLFIFGVETSPNFDFKSWMRACSSPRACMYLLGVAAHVCSRPGVVWCGVVPVRCNLKRFMRRCVCSLPVWGFAAHVCPGARAWCCARAA